MIKAAAISQQSFIPAFESAKNFAAAAVDFMYGTPERVKFTYAFAFALLILGMSMMPAVNHGMSVCAM